MLHHRDNFSTCEEFRLLCYKIRCQTYPHGSYNQISPNVCYNSADYEYMPKYHSLNDNLLHLFRICIHSKGIQNNSQKTHLQ